MSQIKRRVVVTGLGAVTPLGLNAISSWNKLLSGMCGITRIPDPQNYNKIPCQIAASIVRGTGPEEFNITNYVSKSESRTMSLSTVYAMAAASEALEDAKWIPESNISRERTGVCIGVGMADLLSIQETSDALKEGYSKVSPFFVPKILPNMASGHVSIRYDFQGPNHTVSTACATGCHAIGDAFKFIQNDYADVMVCGGAEACITPLAMAGFCRLRALCTSANDSPETSSRPFDKTREGFVMGEGSAVLILEELGHALNRGCNIYAEILGYGLSGDAHHITAPKDNGKGAILAMNRALLDSNKKASDISYINAHATSTPIGDAIELRAISSLFADSISSLFVSSTKGAHGHLLGAAGNLESLFTVLAIFNAVIPPTINLNDKCEEGANINCVPNKSQEWHAKKKVALKNSFGFGGTNACLCIGEYN